MKEEFNLSEKISWDSLPPRNEEIIDHGVISTINVKEFIRLLKEEINKDKPCMVDISAGEWEFDVSECLKFIDKLAGDKLI
jgi:hypothetical protein